MSYIANQPYKCVKCGHEFLYSPHEFHSAPKTSDGSPVCSNCWDTFLEGIGLGMCTVAWSKAGSEYDQYKRMLNEP